MSYKYSDRIYKRNFIGSEDSEDDGGHTSFGCFIGQIRREYGLDHRIGDIEGEFESVQDMSRHETRRTRRRGTAAAGNNRIVEIEKRVFCRR